MLFTEIVLLTTNFENLEASWPQGLNPEIQALKYNDVKAANHIFYIVYIQVQKVK